jgi:hypothetical protein
MHQAAQAQEIVRATQQLRTTLTSMLEPVERCHFVISAAAAAAAAEPAGQFICAEQPCQTAICIINAFSQRGLDRNLKPVSVNMTGAAQRPFVARTLVKPNKAVKPAAAFCIYVPNIQLNGANCSSKCLTANPGVCQDGTCRGSAKCSSDICAGEACSELTRQCDKTPVSDGFVCTLPPNNTACFSNTTTGSCLGGSCQGIPKTDCTVNAPSCQRGTCDSITGVTCLPATVWVSVSMGIR